MHTSNQFAHMYQVGAYLKSHNKFYENIFNTKGLSSKGMFRFSDINVEIQGENENY